MLQYRFIALEDKKDYQEILMDPLVSEPAGFKAASNEQEFERLFAKMHLNHAISILLDEKVIGYVDLYPESLPSMPDKKCVGIGFALKRKHWHQGYGTEMLQYFSQFLKTKLDYVICDAFVENESSNRLIQKCGFQYQYDYSMFMNGLQQEKQLHRYIR